MSWSEDELREVYAELMRRSPAASSCPDPAVLERYLLGTATATDRSSLADHLETCERCSGFLQELRSLSAWAERASEHERRRSPLLALRAPWVPALAASLVLVLGGTAIWWWLASTTPPGSDVERGLAQQVAPAPGAELGARPQRFDWPDQPGATGYLFELYDERAELLWSSDRLTSSECELPEEVRARLADGGSYSWQVEVGGLRSLELGPYWFRLDVVP